MKRVLALVIAVVMAAGLMGCGASEEDTALANEVLSAAAERKETILNSATDIVKSDEHISGETYSGTAYYISNNGSDSNNGLSPDTAFATLTPFKNLQLSSGDAIFFERGGLWRCQMVPRRLIETSGITYSAYGEGEKPKLYYSPESGVGEEKWTLAYEDGEKKIWAFHSEMSEVAAIILNGETPVIRDVAYWDGNSYYVAGEDYATVTNTPYVMEEQLADMRCFPALYYPKDAEATGRVYVTDYGENGPELVKGTLYFRCDAGNPGGLYDEIEFISPGYLMDGMFPGTVIDNLNIQYSVDTFTTGLSGEDCIIQNCEIAWMGGGLFHYSGGELGDDRTYIAGGAINLNGGCIAANRSGNIIRNNYVHHGYQEGIAVETFRGDASLENVLVSGNLVEKCVQPLLICNWDTQVDPNHIFINLVIEDNYALYQGEDNWYYFPDAMNYEAVIKLQGGPCGHDGSMRIDNNVFAFAKGSLVRFSRYSEEYSKVFNGNTYIIGRGMEIVSKEGEQGATTKNDAAKQLGDESAVFARVNLDD